MPTRIARLIALACLVALTGSATADDKRETLWNTYEGKEGPGKGKYVVLVSGDEEYRSEEACTQLAKILANQHGFTCTVLYPINPDGNVVDPNYQGNIPGLFHLAEADLMVVFLRFRNLPDEQMEFIDTYLRRGKPVIGLRTATHAFNTRNPKWQHYSNGYNGPKQEWKGGFGRLVLGEKWISHHGRHKSESSRGVIAEGAADHPITRGLKTTDIWGPSDVYGVRLPLPGDSEPLILGQVVKREGPADPNDPLYGMRPTDKEPNADRNDPMMPIAWTKSYQLPGGKPGQSFTSTIGASTDLLSEGVRRLIVNAAYFLTGLAEEIPADGTSVELAGNYQPTAFQFHKGDYFQKLGKTPADYR